MKDNWSRFTLMDGLVLIAACALGTGVATNLVRTDDALRHVEMVVVWPVASVLISGVIAGPLVLLDQLFRGRRVAPTWGEWFWLAPALLYVSMCTFARSEYGVLIVLMSILLQVLCSLIAFCRLVFCRLGMTPEVACRWTEILGCVVCSAIGPAIAYCLTLALYYL
jgi:hypothetical protein